MTAEPLPFLLMVVAGWVNRRQLQVIDYLKEENRVLREQLGGRRLRFTDDQRRRLAAKGKILGRRLLDDLAGLVTPETIKLAYSSPRPQARQTNRPHRHRRAAACPIHLDSDRSPRMPDVSRFRRIRRDQVLAQDAIDF